MDFDQKFGPEALTFDDVLLLPAKSDVLPRDCDVSTLLTREIRLSIPLVSSPMDTVTEARMAITLAREGGIGVLHKSMDVGRQAQLVNQVKRSENGVIRDPISCNPEDAIRKAQELMGQYHISGVPVVDRTGLLVGIITNRDVRFEENWDQPISAVMTKEHLVTAPEGTTLEQAKDILRKHKVEKLPLVDSRGMLKGLITIKDIEKVRKYPNAAKDARGRLLVAAAVGATPQYMERVDALVEAGVDVVVVDSAHGQAQGVLSTVSGIKHRHPKLQVIGGNVSTYDGARDMCEAGADAIRVGMGPGSICTTRMVAGIGVPQITAVYESTRAASQYGVPVIADGGVRYSGDIVKALAAGAHVVMMGSVFAGTDESPGDTEIYQGRSFKVYRAMGSLGAMRDGSPDRYFQEKGPKLVPEGIEGRVPSRGPVSDTIFQLVGGLRAGMGYCGTRNIEELRKNGRFIRITSSGVRESHPHDVQITKEAPNYTPL
ncbi:IMP dehydrogenase [Cystobacter fuscus]|uniref:Inosine-5'-monophosphate dehydrogenase n=1 Tax=Cystobacter fuscus TaxID=43 RepID=A0A250JAV6_9BACT|nr:IMP dehydrogenase [Cystobacter fuscus]ATB40710.1 IMP dehydrogenase [Cystobacter fuscus]